MAFNRILAFVGVAVVIIVFTTWLMGRGSWLQRLLKTQAVAEDSSLGACYAIDPNPVDATKIPTRANVICSTMTKKECQDKNGKYEEVIIPKFVFSASQTCPKEAYGVITTTETAECLGGVVPDSLREACVAAAKTYVSTNTKPSAAVSGRREQVATSYEIPADSTLCLPGTVPVSIAEPAVVAEGTNFTECDVICRVVYNCMPKPTSTPPTIITNPTPPK